MVQNVLIWVQNNTKYENGQNSPKHFWANFLIFEYVHLAKYLLVFSRPNIFGYSFVIYLCWQIYSDIHSSNIYDSEYIWIFIVSQKWLKMVIIGPKCSKITKNGRYGQNSPKECGTNILIFKYVLVYVGEQIYLPKY